MTDTLPADAPAGAIALTGGAWMTLRDPAKIVQGDREDIIDAITHLRDDESLTPAMRGIKGDQALLAHAVTGWSLDEPLPSEDPTVFRRLPLPVYDALVAAVKPFSDALFPSSKLKEPAADDAERTGPTGPSSD